LKFVVIHFRSYSKTAAFHSGPLPQLPGAWRTTITRYERSALGLTKEIKMPSPAQVRATVQAIFEMVEADFAAGQWPPRWTTAMVPVLQAQGLKIFSRAWRQGARSAAIFCKEREALSIDEDLPDDLEEP
jgi:hypothetical protein